MSFWLIQCLNGLSHASTLFIMAAGLTLVFGVTRIVNFAHGSFYMLGALVAGTLVTQWLPAWSEHGSTYLLAMLLGATSAALLGGFTEVFLFRPLRHSPPLYPLVATFGLSLVIHDVLLWALGPGEVFAPRFPGLKGAVQVGEDFFPQWQIVTLCLGPVYKCFTLMHMRVHLLLKLDQLKRFLKRALCILQIIVLQMLLT